MTPKKSRQSKQAEKPRHLSWRHGRKTIEAWQIEHIREGIRQADAGEFATDSEMKTTFSRRRK
jgi:predicted transcriptional regulator